MKELTIGQMADPIQAVGFTIGCMARGSIFGARGGSMRGSIRGIRNMGLGSTLGQMAVNTLDNGSTIKDMVKANLSLLMEFKGKEFGRMIEESDGLMNLNFNLNQNLKHSLNESGNNRNQFKVAWIFLFFYFLLFSTFLFNIQLKKTIIYI